MTEFERRERIHALAEIIDDFIEDDSRFMLVVFPAAEPAEIGDKLRFDVICSHIDHMYVLSVLRHVLEGIEEHEGETMGDRPN